MIQTTDGQRITDQDVRAIAVLAFSTPETVRRVLRGADNIKPATRERIAQVVQEYFGCGVPA